MEYKCSVCSEAFKDLKQLLFHKRAHLDVTLITPQSVCKSEDTSLETMDNPLSCDVCYRSYESEGGCRYCKQLINACKLEQHEAKVHFSADDQYEVTTKVKCKVCSEPLSNLKQLMLHKKARSVTPKLGFKPSLTCDVCWRKYKSEAALGCHLKTHYLPVQCQCKRFFNACDLEQHQQQHTAKVLSCHECDYSGYDQLEMVEHLRAQHPKPNLYFCQLCDAEYLKKIDLERHVRIEHSRLSFICKECGEMFSTEDHYKAHSETHSSIKFLQPLEGKPNVEQEKTDDSSKVLNLDGSETQGEASTENTSSGCQLKSHYILVKCRQCKRIFNACDLEQHKQQHAAKVLTCHECDYSADDQVQMVKHLSAEHPQPSPYLCQFCDAEYLKKIDLDSHVQTEHSSLSFNCKDCGQTFSTEDNYKVHCETHSSDASSSMDFLPLPTRIPNFKEEDGSKVQENALTGNVSETQIEASSEDLVQSESCDTPSVQEKETDKDNSGTAPDASNREQDLCAICGASFESLEIFKIVKNVRTKIEESVCGDCGKKFLLKARRPHVHIPKGIKCSKCHNVFIDSAQLELHMELKHSKKHNFKCKHCNGLFKFKGNFDRHMATCLQKKTKKYVCETCGKTFLTLKLVNSHSKRHKNIRNFVCEQCGRRFFSLGNLKTHLLVHSDVKLLPFKCSQCEKGFRSNSHLKRHLMWHTGQKPFKCELCNKQCIQKCNLKRHVCKPPV